MKNETRRTYRMGARAKAVAETGERILDATVAMFWEHPGGELSLEEVARRADVSAQTVIRRFGGRQGLIAAAAAREVERTRAQRDAAPVGDVAASVTVLVEHYEQVGERVLRMLAEEARIPALAELAGAGRTLHREWCTRVFAPALAGRTGVDRQRRVAQIVAVCDVYTWKLLRREGALSRRQTERALVELLTPLMTAAT